jgi:hypothetical protein
MFAFGRTRAAILTMVLGLGALGADPPSAVAATEQTPPATLQPPAIDPQARETFARMVDYLRSLQAFTVHAETAREEVVSRDFKVQRLSEVDVTMQRPDRLRAFITGDNRSRTFVYDGKSLVVYTKPENYVATAPAPTTLREMLDTMLTRYGVEMPVLDLLYMAAGGDLSANFAEVGNIGPSQVAGVDCDHVAIRSPKADWQIWIERGDRPLPRRMVITTRDVPVLPEFAANLNWDVSPAIDESVFRFTPPPDARSIPFHPLGAPSPKTRQGSPPSNR